MRTPIEELRALVRHCSMPSTPIDADSIRRRDALAGDLAPALLALYDATGDGDAERVNAAYLDLRGGE